MMIEIVVALLASARRWMEGREEVDRYDAHRRATMAWRAMPAPVRRRINGKQALPFRAVSSPISDECVVLCAVKTGENRLLERRRGRVRHRSIEGWMQPDDLDIAKSTALEREARRLG